MVSRSDRIWVLYPEYFDASRSRSAGRRVNRQDAFNRVTAREIFDAAASLDMGPVLEDHHHPSDWYRCRGRVLVRKELPKEETIRAVSGEIRKKRGEGKDGQ